MRSRPFAGLGRWQLARRIVAPALFVGALFVSVFTYEPPPAPTLEDLALDEVTLSGESLGTTWTVRVVGDAPDVAGQQALADAISEALTEVDQLMSTWKEDSELSRLNRWDQPEPFDVSPLTMAVLMRAEQVWQETSGSFDVTVFPLVKLWGFGGAEPAEQVAEQVWLDVQHNVGQQHVTLDHQAPSVTKAVPGLTVDLSAIAKGYAVDRVALAVSRLGYDDHMVEVGGEVRATGHNRLKRPWRIAVEKPDTMSRTTETAVALSDLSMATSGDYRNFREVDGKRVSHIIDPRTARPAEHALASATVLHRECAFADAYATAMMVLGPDAGLALAEQLKLPVLLLVRDPDGSFVHLESSAFETHRRATPALPAG